MRVILVCDRASAVEPYREVARGHGVELAWVPSFWDLFSAMGQEGFQGVMVDIPTKVRASQAEKETAAQLLALFPVIQLGWDAKSGRIRSHFFQQLKGGRDFTAFFAECASFRPRRIRKELRFSVHFNLRVAREPADLEADGGEKSFTIDVSQGGCFIVTSAHWQCGEQVRLVFHECLDRGIVSGSVRRVVPWGKQMRPPGIGVAFDGGFPGGLETVIRGLALS